MKRFLAVLLILSLCLLTGCNEEESAYIPTGDGLAADEDLPQSVTDPTEEAAEQELVLVYYPDKTMNPYTCTDFTNRALFSLIYQSLFVVDTDYEVSPMLCTRYTVSEDMRTYVFYVDGATFSDGTPLTIEDVYESLQAARTSKIYKGRFLHVTSLKLDETGGVIFQLDTAYENFPLLLDIPIVKAVEIESDRPLGTGPYYMEQSHSGMRLRRRTNWWCDPEMIITASSISLVEVSDQGQIRDEFQFGEVGLATANPMSDSFEEYRCDYELWDVETGLFLYLGVNVTFSEYFNKEDKTLRKALTYAIDRQKLIEDNYHGLAHAATLAVSPASPYYNENMASKYHYDPMKFIDMLSGWAPLKNEDTHEEKKLVLLVNSDDSARLRTARDISDTLNELGVPCGTLEYGNSTNPTYEVVLRANNWDLVLGQTKLSPNYDLSEFFRPWGELNWGGITNNTLYSQCLLALDNSGNYYNLLKDVQETSSIIPILFGYNTVYAERGMFDNLTPARDNIFFYTLGKTMEGTKLETVYN